MGHWTFWLLAGLLLLEAWLFWATANDQSGARQAYEGSLLLAPQGAESG